MSQNGLLNIYLLFVSLFSLLIPTLGFLMGRKANSHNGARALFSIPLLIGALLCLDGYERVNFLVSGYFENKSITETELNELLKTIGLWKFSLPAILAGIGISLLAEVFSDILQPKKS